MAVGRISGPLLKANLLRQGVDLAFETDLVYLKVVDDNSTNHRVGIKTNDPTHTLTVNGITRTTNLIVDNLAEIADITISGTTISTTEPVLTLAPSGSSPVVFQNKLRIDQIDIVDNIISTNTANTNLELRPNGTGSVNVFSDLTVNGNIHATGNITADGNIQIGDTGNDNISFTAEIASDIIPDIDNTYDLGSDHLTGGKRWADVWTNNLYTNAVITGDITVDGINLNLNQGKIIYVATNGDDTYSGTHQNDPFATVKHALSQASSGDTVYIYPGTYTEVFPMTVPVGVTIKGSNIRAVKIVPTLATNNKDVFLLNGEVTIEDLTIADFFYDSVNNTGHAFRFTAGYAVTSRSPYIRNITVLTKGSVTSVGDPLGFNQGDAGRGAYLDGSVASIATKEASCLFHSVTFITPGVDCITTTNGTRIEWLNSFTYYANKSVNAISGSTGIAGLGKTELRLTGQSGTFSVGNSVTYYDADGITPLASGSISKIDVDGKIYLTGKVAGFETQFERGGKTIQAFGNAQLSTAQKKFGATSLALDGTGDYAYVQSHPDFAFGTGDFCIEAWVYPTATGTYRTLFDLRNNSSDTGGIILGLSDLGALYFFYNGNYRVGPVGSVPINQWTHIALARQGGQTKAFISGVQVGATYTDSNNYGTRGVRIGADPNGNYAFPGYFDDVRISRGVSRYNANFSVPTGTLPNDPYAVLLSRFDGANTSTTFVDETFLVQDIRSSAGGTATAITLVDYSDFGTEIRSIASAAVYGNYGFYGDGLGVIAYLIGQNLAYIGVGNRSDNDNTFVIQANEIVELNGAKIYYSSVDHKGDFRVGDLFYINQQAGTVEFTSSTFNINSVSGVTFTNGTDVTYIDGTRIDTGNLRLSGNTLSSLSGDINIVAASDQINLENNVNIAGNLDVVGDVTIGGNITLGNQDTDTISFVGGIVSDIVPNATETYSLGTSGFIWANAYYGNAQIDSVNINGNTISSTTTNTDLVISANGTGIISIPSNDVSLGLTLTVNGSTDLRNTSITGTVTHTGDVNQVGNTTVTGDVGVTGNLTVGNEAQFKDVKIVNNQITTTIGNNDLQLLANGTGRIYVPSNDVEFGQALTVLGTTSTTTLNNTGRITSDEFYDGNILIADNVIETLSLNSDLNLIANGTGVIKIEEFDFSSNIISSNTVNDIVIQPGTGKTVTIDSDQSVIIPIGTTSERPLTPQAGMIRFNTTLSRYEGYDGADWIRLDSRVTDLDENTTITAELTPGANDDTIRFYNNGVLTANLTATRLEVPRIEIDNIAIDNNTISAITPNTDLLLNASGTGSVRLANFAIKDNVITNTVSGGITTITQTGNGYFKIAGTNGFVVPTGNSVQRPAYAVTGMTRYNAELKQLEVYNGSTWESAAGSSGAINAVTASDIAITYALILG